MAELGYCVEHMRPGCRECPETREQRRMLERNLTPKQARKKRDGRETAAFVALADGEWASFEELRERTGMKGRALKGALGRLMRQGRVRERGAEPDEEYRRIYERHMSALRRETGGSDEVPQEAS